MFNPLPRHLVLSVLLSLSVAQAAPNTGSVSTAKEWEYPELVVTPRASERVEREARLEARHSWKVHWQIQVSSLATFSAGLLQLLQTANTQDPDKLAAWTGVGVGGGWLVASWLLSGGYRPYGSGLEEINTLPKASQRDQLARERSAEETLASASRLSQRLRWISFATNLAASINLAANAESKSLSQVVDLVSVGLAFTPLVFQPRWIRVHQDQMDYKKRIFGPITSVVPSTLWIRTSQASVSPALGLRMTF